MVNGQDSPVRGAKLPEELSERDEMHPFRESELADVIASATEHSLYYAQTVKVLAWTGLRWGELRALRVGDITWEPTPALRVARNQPEGQEVKVTKGRKPRRVPVAAVIIPILRSFAAGKRDHELVFAGPNGGMLWRRSFTRALEWKKIGRGRRIHDLRHTAACIWLARGVDLSTVQAWLGHASVSTANRYLHYLGTSADQLGLDLLNAGGTPGVRDDESESS